MERLFKTTWHDFPGFALGSEALQVIIVPGFGAKIVSMYDKRHDREWLVPPIRPVKPTFCVANFVDQDMSGWDEMLPTIDACEWQGVHLPDHGEVWSIPWKLEGMEDDLTMSVEGQSFPYHFIRSASLIAPGTLELGYSLTNTGQMELPYLWATHPQFATDENTRILIPTDVTQVVNVIDDDPIWGKAGEVYDWPVAIAANGQVLRLDRIGPAKKHTCRKMYALPQQPVAWVALVDGNLGCQIRLEWPSDFAPI